jgi:hypothetical protein
MKQICPPLAQRPAPAGPGLFHIETQDWDLKYGGLGGEIGSGPSSWPEYSDQCLGLGLEQALESEYLGKIALGWEPRFSSRARPRQAP